ncbi:hypothetical protein BJ878DRAFT_171465 [Calycina marina]|uniref:Homeobox domain-containing protein n=1 Tax=Calycina marina TaxID=1763456 RepID=A0A9P7Z8V7_9HELO|nr:hypothetical protein BJ878DRAFT_171465 [Calycina marina]
MSDAVLPHRSTSAAPEGNALDSNIFENDQETRLYSSSGSESKEESSILAGSKADRKQKRKRTSAKDQAILEAEYRGNPKPNKAARAGIVQKVDLNEKEVQVWFQNRRQINRRKSRPLLPHEVAALGLGGMLSSDPVTVPVSRSTIVPGADAMNTDAAEESSGNGKGGAEQHEDKPSSKLLEHIASEVVEIVQAVSNEVAEPELPKVYSPAFNSQASSDGPPTPSTNAETVGSSFTSTPGHLASRWSLGNSFSTPSSSSQAQPAATPPGFLPSLPPCSEKKGDPVDSKSRSKVRLSMGLDGKAELVESASSSPPREGPVRPSSSVETLPQHRRSLQRSQSAHIFGNSSHRSPYNESIPLLSESTHSSPRNVSALFAPKLKVGRSRDSRTWVFACDPDARDELTTQAENESSGSAVAAISLIRSTSNSALKPNSNKRNAPALKHDSSANAKKPKLVRAQSGVAMLQRISKPVLKPVKSGKGYDGLMKSPSGDSDKENWVMGEEHHARRRRLPSSKPDSQQNSKAVLRDSHKIMSHAGNLGVPKGRRRMAGYAEPKVFEDEGNAGGEEVERFMNGNVSPSKKGDLDCIQGLLSLSQGNWQ